MFSLLLFWKTIACVAAAFGTITVASQSATQRAALVAWTNKRNTSRITSA